MRFPLLALAVALTAGYTNARAEIVTYNMTGTITPAYPVAGSPSFAVGDRISWTLQYDTATALHGPLYGTAGYFDSSNLGTPLITSITDKTTGVSFYVPPTVTWSTLTLSSGPPTGNANYLEANQSASDVPNHPERFYGVNLDLDVKGVLPTFNLAKLSLDHFPLNRTTSAFYYTIFNQGTDSSGDMIFMASIDSISAPVHGAAEPGSLTLLLLGAVGLRVRGPRRV